MELLEKITLALDEIRPILMQDDGDVEFVRLTEHNIVEVRLMGNCKVCPLSVMTIRAGIEATIKRYAPEVVRVEKVN